MSGQSQLNNRRGVVLEEVLSNFKRTEENRRKNDR